MYSGSIFRTVFQYIQAPVGKCSVSDAKVRLYLSTLIRMHVKYTLNAPWIQCICVYSVCSGVRVFSCGAQDILHQSMFSYILEKIVYVGIFTVHL